MSEPRGRGHNRGRGAPRGRGDGQGGGGGGDRGGGGYRVGRGQSADRGSNRGGRGDSQGGGDRGGDRGGGGYRGGGYRAGRGQSSDRGFRGGHGGRGGGRGGRGGFSSGTKEPTKMFGEGEPVPQPDPVVRKIEDAYIKEKQGFNPSALKIKQDFPLRPAYGSRGENVVLWANYFPLNINPNTCLYRYKVEVAASDKPIGSKTLKRIFQLLLEDHFADNRNRIATDYKATLVTNERLNLASQSFDIKYRMEGEDQPPPKHITYKLRIIEIPSLTLSDLIKFLASPTSEAFGHNKEEYTQALNIVIGHYPKSNPDTFNVGPSRHFEYDTKERYRLGGGLEVIRGFFVSARPVTSRLLLNVQVSHVVCYDPKPLPTLFKEMNYNYRTFERLFKKVSIQLLHLPRDNGKGGNIRYRTKNMIGMAHPRQGRDLDHPPIIDSDDAGPANVKFYMEDTSVLGKSQPKGKGNPKGAKGKGKAKTNDSETGGYVSVYDYFSSRYGLTMDKNLAVLNVGTEKEPTYIPAEVCRIAPGQAAKRKPSPSQTSELMKFAPRKPVDNAISVVTNGARIIGALPGQQADILTTIGVQIQPQLITVEGRILVGPVIRYQNTKQQPHKASWNLANVKFLNAAPALKNWACLNLGGPNPDPDGAVRNFITVSQKEGLNLDGNFAYFNHPINPNAHDIEPRIDSIFKNVTHSFGVVKLLLIILPNDNAKVYKRIKLNGDVNYGIHTVCVIHEKFLKNQSQYQANVSMKFNLKLGGINHSVPVDKLGIVGQGKTMVVGIDVTHPSPGSSELAPSIAGMVASIDANLGQWPAVLRIQKVAKSEMVDDLADMLASRLQLWHKKNKSFPENIIVYRDGVSEGQYNKVLEEEYPLLIAGCKKVYPNMPTQTKLPRMTIIVVGKRHNTRFYPTKESDALDGNAKPGTIVDRGVTETRNWNFYLQAHHALKGTAKPCHYFVILDEIFSRRANPAFNSPADELEDLTHNMCYCFGRATKAVSLCPPAYYADILCERARGYLNSYYDDTVSIQSSGPDPRAIEIHERLHDTMFYI
ncbi:hypothetical protein FQN57_003465 [Myotisia sp. PD_48]|nr:hypothetical protein FQN57_003465 [Myotisia sp. PD_48]